MFTFLSFMVLMMMKLLKRINVRKKEKNKTEKKNKMIISPK